MEDNRKKGDSADEFWKLDSLVPKRRSPSVFESKHIEPVDIEIPVTCVDPYPESRTEKIPAAGQIKRYVHPHTPHSEKTKKADEEYNPEKSLIHSVRLYSWSTLYPYYESFRRSAVYYFNKSSPKVPETTYFSYMPQYSQLNDQQLSFYLWMRGEIREGRYPSADYSYLLLLIYETINLSDRVPVERSIELLVAIWLNYRAEYPRLDVQLSEWVFDMCLIGKKNPPHNCLKIVGNSLPSSAGIREFYADAIEDSAAFADLLLAYCSNYDYRKSKFAVGENLPIYEKHMKGVVAYIISKCSDPAHPFELSGFKMQDSKAKRDAYTGALCSPKVKRRIEFDYCSFSHSHELRFVVTDILKYAENKIRSYLGIKSRLSVNSLSDQLKILANEYFEKYLPTVHNSTHHEDLSADYEKLYEPLTHGLSFESAAKIEEQSWETTRRFIETFEVEEMPASFPESIAPSDISVDIESTDDTNSIFEESDIAFLRAALDDDYNNQIRIAHDFGIPIELIVDSVNTKAVDSIGDILLEESDLGYTVIDDYKDEVRDIINSYTDKRSK